MDMIEITNVDDIGYTIKDLKDEKIIAINTTSALDGDTTIVVTDKEKIAFAIDEEERPIIMTEKLEKENVITVEENEVYWIDNDKAVTILPNKNIFIKIKTYHIIYIYEDIQQAQEQENVDIVILTQKFIKKQPPITITTKNIQPEIIITQKTEKETHTIQLEKGEKITITRHLTQLYIKKQTRKI